MNQITVSFGECAPEPVNGYNIQYRVYGSSDPYTDAGNFSSSPAVFTDSGDPGTRYEGFIQSDCGDGLFGNPIPWATQAEECTDDSSCGTMISQETTGTGYVNLGKTVLHVCGGTHVELHWSAYDRPNRFSLYDNGTLVESTGWKGSASYPGPWGLSLSTTNTGVIAFNPVAGHTYELNVEVGPADPVSPLNDTFDVLISCT